MEKKQKITFITTVLNEEQTIVGLLQSLLEQTIFPDEIIIVDGGSTDGTESRIKNYESRIKKKKIKFCLISKKGNRAVGRNEAIRNATSDIITCSDAGNILHKKWIENITKPFADARTDVVAGYYQGRASTVFETCLIPYVLVMPDKLDPKSFLPATRSIAFRKSVWVRAGGFVEKYAHNEDYVFARKLRKISAKIFFAKAAIVFWQPRRNFREAYTMFYRFALGDAEAKIYRPKVAFLFFRYLLGVFLCIIFAREGNLAMLGGLGILLFIYLIWSIRKNYRYVHDYRALVILPLLQCTADIAVIHGTIKGIYTSWDIQKKQ